jgi:hypothetical protein
MNRRGVFLLVAAAAGVATMARGGHELPVYPSYYPHEIEIATKPPEQAAALLRSGKLHAYIGAALPTAGPDANIGVIESLGSYVLVRINPQSARASQEASACAIVEAVLRDLAQSKGDLIFHPYPVTPYHGDYLHHVDLAEAARERLLSSSAAAAGVKVKAEGPLASRLIKREWRAEALDWDVAIEEVSAAQLMAASSLAVNGWLGPRWVRSGWFHAYRLLADASGAMRADNQHILQRLEAGEYGGRVERINLERELVRSLVAQSRCRLAVAGYSVKRESVNVESSSGVENIAFDAIAGLNSPLFLRTVKLKDFPWNGWLALGVPERPAAAWNPVGGFTDEFGRLMWFALADPALLPSPYEATWMLNRMAEAKAEP